MALSGGLAPRQGEVMVQDFASVEHPASSSSPPSFKGKVLGQVWRFCPVIFNSEEQFPGILYRKLLTSRASSLTAIVHIGVDAVLKTPFTGKSRLYGLE